MLIKNLSFLVGLKVENQKKWSFWQDDILGDFWDFLCQNYPEILNFGGFTLETPKNELLDKMTFWINFLVFHFQTTQKALSF